MREVLFGLTPHLRRYAHALLGRLPTAAGRTGERLRADQDADDIVHRAVLGFWRTSRSDNGAPAPVSFFSERSLRLALYRRVTTLARERLLRPVREEAAARLEFNSAQQPARHVAWAPEAQALPRLAPDMRAILALVVLERMDYEEAAEVLDLDPDQILPRLAVARARLAGVISGVTRPHLTLAAVKLESCKPESCKPESGGAESAGAAPPTEGELHRFVDEKLDRDRTEQISLWLEDDVETTRRAAEWRRNAERLRAAFEPLLHTPLPLSLNFDSPGATFWAERRKARRRGFFGRLAAKWASPQSWLQLRSH